MRYAIYYAPKRDSEMERRAASWFGRSPYGGERCVPAGPAQLIAEPRRYGFHATLKAPFHLSGGRSESELDDALSAFARSSHAIEFPMVAISRLGPFFALRPSKAHRPLQQFAAQVVRSFEPFRAPLGAAEIQRRASMPLTDRQRENLMQWGHPYVLDDFRFHMTLTSPVPRKEQESVFESLAAHFNCVLSHPLRIDRLALFVEPRPGADFIVHSVHELSA